MADSPRHGRRLHFVDAEIRPRSHCLFHIGNRVKETRGCILPGLGLGKIDGDRAVLNSGRALAEIEKELGAEPFRLRIVIGYPDDGHRSSLMGFIDAIKKVAPLLGRATRWASRWRGYQADLIGAGDRRRRQMQSGRLWQRIQKPHSSCESLRMLDADTAAGAVHSS